MRRTCPRRATWATCRVLVTNQVGSASTVGTSNDTQTYAPPTGPSSAEIQCGSPDPSARSHHAVASVRSSRGGRRCARHRPTPRPAMGRCRPVAVRVHRGRTPAVAPAGPGRLTSRARLVTAATRHTPWSPRSGDWATGVWSGLVAAAISALVGTLVFLATISQTTVRACSS